MLKRWKSFYFGIWDTAGQEKFSRISSYYSRGAQAAILAYDITDRRTFDNLSDYVRFLAEAEKGCYMVLIGTKLDLVREDPDKRQVTEEMAKEFAATHSAPFFETSAKDGLNVASVFDTIGYHCFATKLSSTTQEVAAMPGPTRTPSSDFGAAPRADSSTMCCIIQ